MGTLAHTGFPRQATAGHSSDEIYSNASNRHQDHIHLNIFPEQGSLQRSRCRSVGDRLKIN